MVGGLRQAARPCAFGTVRAFEYRLRPALLCSTRVRGRAAARSGRADGGPILERGCKRVYNAGEIMAEIVACPASFSTLKTRAFPTKVLLRARPPRR